MKRKVFIYLAALALFLNLCACGEKETKGEQPAAAMNASVEPSGGQSKEPTKEPSRQTSAEPSNATASASMANPTPAPAPVPTPEPMPVPTLEPTPEPTPIPTPAPTPEPTPRPLNAGTFTAPDGSELTVKRDGSVSYKTEVSGKINGAAMSAVLTFTGEMGDEGFTFTKVSYGALDLTEIARANGLDDASHWEAEAWALYTQNYGNGTETES